MMRALAYALLFLCGIEVWSCIHICLLPGAPMWWIVVMAALALFYLVAAVLVVISMAKGLWP